MRQKQQQQQQQMMMMSSAVVEAQQVVEMEQLDCCNDSKAMISNGIVGRKAKCNSGKLFLAAIVHYDSLEAQNGVGEQQQQGDCDKNQVVAAATTKTQEQDQKKVDLKQQHVNDVVVEKTNTHEDGKQRARFGGTFARLFSLRSRGKEESTKSINSTKTTSKNNELANGRQTELGVESALASGQLQMGNYSTCMMNEQIHHSTTTSTTTTSTTPEGSKRSLEDEFERYNRRHVIEFKFDLIVEGDEADEKKKHQDLNRQMTTTLANKMTQQQGEDKKEQEQEQDEEEEQEVSHTRASGQSDRMILRPIKQRKLLDQVNELVESFALDSMDVCLMSSGRRKLPDFPKAMIGSLSEVAAALPVLDDVDQFDYALQLAQLTLTYSFQLLQATREQAIKQRDASTWNYLSNSNSSKSTTPLMIDDFSLDIEAILFSDDQQASDGESIVIIDLLAATSDQENKSNRTGVECRTQEEALEVLQLIRRNLLLNQKATNQTKGTPSQTSHLLMVGLKLKRLINGGLFTNRLCLLDLGRPASCKLSVILECIFSGQALAHLKRQKTCLKTLEIQLDLMKRMEQNESALKSQRVQELENDNLANDHQVEHEPVTRQEEFLKKHHRVASLTRLLQAEWLIYKQLSAALIQSLVIVHCHRPAQLVSKGTTNQQQTKTLGHLMDYNLQLLEFAQRIQRASQGRLKRRRRHLRRSHLLSSATNLSFVSDTNLSIDLNDKDEEDEEDEDDYLNAGNYAGRRDSSCAESTNYHESIEPTSSFALLDQLYKRRQRRRRQRPDLMISSPFRHHRITRHPVDWNQRLDYSQLDLNDNDDDQLTNQINYLNEAASLHRDDNLLMQRHLRSLSATRRHHHHHQHHRARSHQRHRNRRHYHYQDDDFDHHHHHPHHHHINHPAAGRQQRYQFDTVGAVRSLGARPRAASLSRQTSLASDLELDDDLSADTSPPIYRAGRLSSVASTTLSNQQQQLLQLQQLRQRHAELTGSSSLSTSSGSRSSSSRRRPMNNNNNNNGAAANLTNGARISSSQNGGAVAAAAAANSCNSQSSSATMAASSLMVANNQLQLQQQQRVFSAKQTNQQANNLPSDTEDSLASATLNSSCLSTSSLRERQRVAELGAKVFKVMQNRSSREEEAHHRWLQAGANGANGSTRISSNNNNKFQQQALSVAQQDGAESMASSSSIELQSFCKPVLQVQHCDDQSMVANTIELEAEALELPDNASDICSVVAEPPRQLKLEEFLNQLSSAIAPDKNKQQQQRQRPGVAAPAVAGAAGVAKCTPNRLSSTNGCDEDEDEDCKSHSSILDHLSSLTLESNLKLHQQQHQQQQQQLVEINGLNGTPSGFDVLQEDEDQVKSSVASGRVNILDEQSSGGLGSYQPAASGHLQHLLKSTLQMHNNNNNNNNSNKLLEKQLQQRERLQALTIDCQSQSGGQQALVMQQATGLPLSLNVNSAPNSMQQTTTPATATTFTPTSIDSSCSSSSATSSSSVSASANQDGALAHHHHQTLNQLYSSIIRQHT